MNAQRILPLGPEPCDGSAVKRFVVTAPVDTSLLCEINNSIYYIIAIAGCHNFRRKRIILPRLVECYAHVGTKCTYLLGKCWPVKSTFTFSRLGGVDIMGVSIRKNVDLEKYIDEVTTAQMTMVGNVMMVFVASLFLRPVQYWSTFRAKFENEGLSRSAYRIDPFLPILFQYCSSLRKWS